MNGRISKLFRKMCYLGITPAQERSQRKRVMMVEKRKKRDWDVGALCLDPRALCLLMKNKYNGGSSEKEREQLRAEAMRIIDSYSRKPNRPLYGGSTYLGKPVKVNDITV